MKNLSLLFIGFFIIQSAVSQSILLNEDFEGTSNAFTSSSASGNGTPWAVTSSLASGGTYSDSNTVQLGDTLFLTSNAFSTLNYSFVKLEFFHIAKIHMSDKALVEVSSDNGASWTTLTDTEYMGSAFFSPNNYFSSLSYINAWDPVNTASIPKKSWWKKEEFNISSIANSANAKIRFVLIDADNNGSRGSYGWLLDDVTIKGAACELTPPSISINGVNFSGNVYTKGPYNIIADVQDASGISSVQLNYSVDNGPIQTLVMNNSSGNLFKATIPMMNYGDTVCYSIKAIDNSQCSNIQNFPSVGCTKFFVVQGTPNFCNGNIESSYPYNEDFESFIHGGGYTAQGTFMNDWFSSTSVGHYWRVEDFSTLSANTGPDADHTTGSGQYLYIEASGNFNKTAILESPCFDLSGYGKKIMGFWYHMYGSTMGELHIDVETPSGTIQDIVPPIVGNQGNQWKYKEIDLSTFSGNVIKFKFRGITGISFNSDIAIDDFTVYEEPIDVALQSLVSPSPSGCSGGAAEYVTVSINNLGSTSVTTIPVAYQVNAGPIVRDTAFLNIPSSSSALFTFQQTVDMSNLSNYNFKLWTELNNDGDNSNDTLKNINISTSQFNYLLPDTQNFESFTVGTPGIFADGWMNDVTFPNQWNVNTGSTPTVTTGPSGDTSTATGNGNYLYMDAASSTGQFASVMSACMDFGSMLQPKMRFFYHMYGADIGKLHVDVIMNGMRFNDIVPPIVGDQGNKWNEMLVELSQYSNICKIAFRAEKGSGNLGDIAIDNIIFYEDPVGIEEKTEEESLAFQFYPNPSQGKIQVEITKGNLGGTFSIRDISGKLLKEMQMNIGIETIDLADFNPGIYFVSYNKGGEISIDKLILY